MSGKASRNRGKVGEREARLLLCERDWEVDDLTDGTACADFIARDKRGKVYKVEVKNHRSINLPAFLSQARKQAGRGRWLLLARLYGYGGCWLAIGSDIGPCVWRLKGEAK